MNPPAVKAMYNIQWKIQVLFELTSTCPACVLRGHYSSLSAHPHPTCVECLLWSNSNLWPTTNRIPPLVQFDKWIKTIFGRLKSINVRGKWNPDDFDPGKDERNFPHSHTAVWVLAPGKALQKTSERVSKEIQGHYNRLTLYFVPYIVN